MNLPLFTGAVYGLISVAFGAYADHGLKSAIDEAGFAAVMTAVRYNQIYALVIIALGLAKIPDIAPGTARHLSIIAAIFSIGALLFCGSIYVASIIGMGQLTILAPFGGMTLMIGWGYLAALACAQRHARTETTTEMPPAR